MDHYSRLGVAKNATTDDIKKAYRRLASVNHPDRGGNTADFQKIQQAYDILSDQKKRRAYDLSTPTAAQVGNGFDPRTYARPNRLYTVNVSVSLEQVARGDTINIQVSTHTGIEYFSIRIPAAAESSQRYTFDGLMSDGTLQVMFVIRDHVRLTRRKLDIEETKNINVLELLVGTKVLTKDVWGTEFEITIPPFSKLGSKFRIAGRGMKTESGKTGDHYVLIQGVLPDTISDDLQHLLEKEYKGITNDI
jgi:curved DNA-binding protein